MKIIQIENKRTLALLLIGCVIFTDVLINGLNMKIIENSIDYLALILIYLFIIFLFIKIKVEVKQ